MAGDLQQLKLDLDEARALRHPQRAMRVTLECGHLRLMPYINTVMGIGAFTNCRICPPQPNGRLVVNREETGLLFDEGMDRHESEEKPE